MDTNLVKEINDNPPVKRLIAWFLLFFSLTSIALFLFGAAIEPTEQEAYYWLWSQHPALSYFDHPPLQAWLTFFLTSLLGQYAWVIRLPASLGHLILTFLIYRWMRRKYDVQIAWWTTIIFSSAFLTTLCGLIALPDVVMLPLAVLAADYAEQRKPVKGGIALGLSMLAKWHTALLVPGIIYCYLQKRPRRDVTGLIKVACISLILQTPVVLWNFKNGWPSFYYHFIERHQRDHVSAAELFAHSINYLADQIAIAGIAWVVLCFIIWRSRSSLKTKIRDPGVFIWILPMFLIFGISAMRGEYRFYWTGWALIPLAGLLASHVVQLATNLQNRIFLVSVIIMMVNSSLLIFVLGFPVGAYLKPVLDHVHAKYDLRLSPRGDFYGWEAWLDELQSSKTFRPKETIFVASNFRIASRIAWALRNSTNVELGQVTTAGQQNEFAYLPGPRILDAKEIIYIEDNRRKFPNDGKLLPCKTTPTWRVEKILLREEYVKQIRWAICSTRP